MHQVAAADVELAPPRSSFERPRELGARFYALLDEALAEIQRRDATYLSRFPAGMPSTSPMATAYARHPMCAGYDAAIIERALVEGLRYFASAGAVRGPSAGRSDPLARFLCDSIVDAFCADQGALAVEPVPRRERSISQILAVDYSERTTPAGQRYFLRHSGTRPLLLVNALGVPIDIWWRLLGDVDHDFKVIVVESPCGDMLTGGMARYVDISAEVEGLTAVLRAESIGPLSVVGWCSGAKVAIDLAGRHPDQISSLILLAPSLMGMSGVAPDPSPFEKDFRWLTNAIGKRQSLAPSLAQTFTGPRPLIWDSRVEAMEQRAETLFGLPAQERSSALTVPMSEAASLMNLMRRVAEDDSHPTGKILSGLGMPIMAVMGQHDRVIQPPFASLALRTWAKSVFQAILTGSGHYIHDLQYHYFRFLLTEFIDNRRAAPPSARISAG